MADFRDDNFIRLERFPLPQVKADCRQILLKLTQAAVQGGGALFGYPGSLSSAITSLFGAAEAIRIDTPPERLAWYLVHEALKQALTDLLFHLRLQGAVTGHDVRWLPTEALDRLDDADMIIPSGFFDNPGTTPILRALKEDLRDWLIGHGLPDVEARSVIGRFDTKLIKGLHDVWRADPDRYASLKKAFDSPFVRAQRLEQDWLAYEQALVARMEDPVFQETFSIGQVYIDLRAFYKERIELDERAHATRRYARSDERTDIRRVVVDLHEATDNWLANATPESAIRVIRGAPGSGKSTFARKLAADLAGRRRKPGGKEMRVLSFPLQRFLFKADLRTALHGALVDKQVFRENPFDVPDFATSERPLLLVFDGLDELGIEGKDAIAESKLFLAEVRNQLCQWNGDGPVRVMALITGRTVILQQTEEALHLDLGQELTVIGYFVPEEARERYHDPDERLSRDQRPDWWRKYAACKPEEPADMPECLCAEEVTELSAEPLLNYLLVLSGYHQNRQAGAFVNRNTIYDRLMRQILKGVHGGGKAPKHRSLSDEDIEILMETMALAAWYGGEGRVATLEGIRKVCPEDQQTKLEEFITQTGGIFGLVAAFFFQETETARGRGSFEFTHKSFGEYLTARRIIREVATIAVGRTQGARFYSEEQALKHWYSLCGQQRLSYEVLGFLRREVALVSEVSEAQVRQWQDVLLALFDRNLVDGMPALSDTTLAFREADRRARNAEEALFAALNACALVIDEPISPAWNSPLRAGELIHRLRGQDSSSRATIVTQCFAYIDFKGQALYWQDLGQVEAPKANLSRANLSDADLSDANLLGAIMPDLVVGLDEENRIPTDGQT
jgi:hypothetical protein